MSIWKSIYEVQADNKVVSGTVSDVLKVAKAGCKMKIANIGYGSTSDYVTFTECNVVGYYENKTHPESSNVGCRISDIAGNNSKLPIFIYPDKGYQDFSFYNLNPNQVFQSRWYIDGSQDGPQDSAVIHVGWMAEVDCIGYALGLSGEGQSESSVESTA